MLQTMHITHVNFAKGFRGGEKQTLNLIEGLAAAGAAQTLVCRTGSELAQRTSALGFATIQIAHPLVGHVQVPPAGLIHVHEARGAYWAAIENIFRKTPYLITRRIPNPISASYVTTQVYRGAATLVGVSQDVSRLLAAQTNRLVHTILDSCTAYRPAADKVSDIRKQLGGGPIIGHVGALHDHHKGQSVLIESFHRLVASYPDARLVLLGSGPDRAWFEQLARNDKRIFFAGFQTDVGPWMAAMDMLAFPSREEGLGSAVLDAMALGVPVIASSVGGLPELIGDQQRGIMVRSHEPRDWEQTISRMLNDRGLRERYIDAGKAFAAQHDVRSMTERYIARYADILDRT